MRKNFNVIEKLQKDFSAPYRNKGIAITDFQCNTTYKKFAYDSQKQNWCLTRVLELQKIYIEANLYVKKT